MRSFYEELKRRNVLKVAFLYTAFAVAVIAFSSDIEEALPVLPEWTDTLIVLLACTGFPVALIFAWIFDLTPHGVEITKSIDKDGAAATVLPKPHSELASIAVLPFKSVMGEESFLAGAIPLELNNTLSRVHNLRIASPQSALAHAQTERDLRSIAADLNVNYVISGSVARLGNKVRIIAELYDAVGDTLLWSKRFDMDADNVFETELQIAEATAMAFGGERLRLEVDHARAGQTKDQAAWELVHKARGYLFNYTADSVAEAIPLLEQAVQLDANYAVGYAYLGLVTAEKTLNAIGDDPDADRAAAQTAIGRAEALAPGDSVVLRSAGAVHAYCGNNARSIELLRRAVNLAPYDLGTWGYFGWPMVATGRIEHIEELHDILDRLMEMGTKHAGYPYWLFHKSVAYCCEDNCEKALEYIQRATLAQPRFSLGWMHCANVLGRLDITDRAREAAERSALSNPRLTADYYSALVGKLCDDVAVVARRTDGLIKAGLLARLAS